MPPSSDSCGISAWFPPGRRAFFDVREGDFATGCGVCVDVVFAAGHDVPRAVAGDVRVRIGREGADRRDVFAGEVHFRGRPLAAVLAFEARRQGVVEFDLRGAGARHFDAWGFLDDVEDVEFGARGFPALPICQEAASFDFGAPDRRAERDACLFRREVRPLRDPRRRSSGTSSKSQEEVAGFARAFRTGKRFVGGAPAFELFYFRFVVAEL